MNSQTHSIFSCEFCNNLLREHHDNLLFCPDESIFETISKLETRCCKLLNYENNTKNVCDEFEKVIKEIPFLRLKLILCNMPIFNPDLDLNADKKYLEDSGSIIRLQSKVIYLLISNTRRKHVNQEKKYSVVKSTGTL